MKKQTGFTLIEVMIVVVIIAVIAAIAMPSYKNSVQKTRRADAKEALVRLAAAQERYFFSNNSYNIDEVALGAENNHSKDGHYVINVTEIECGTDNVRPCFTITATAQGVQLPDSLCRVFSITHTGQKSAKDAGNIDTSDDCW